MDDLSDDIQQSDTSYTSTSVCHDLSHEGSDRALSVDLQYGHVYHHRSH